MFNTPGILNTEFYDASRHALMALESMSEVVDIEDVVDVLYLQDTDDIVISCNNISSYVETAQKLMEEDTVTSYIVEKHIKMYSPLVVSIARSLYDKMTTTLLESCLVQAEDVMGEIAKEMQEEEKETIKLDNDMLKKLLGGMDDGIETT
jgi:molybdopterin converting factor small subunit